MKHIDAIAFGFSIIALLSAGCKVFDDPTLEQPPKPAGGNAHLEALLYNPKWYRTYDSTFSTTIAVDSGTLLFAWTYADLARYPDSFYLGIDTLWALPQDVKGDTANDWDLQICPDGFCMDGLKNGIHGANAPIHFGEYGEYGDTSFRTEHHFQFLAPNVSLTTYEPGAPPNSFFGALMFVRSRTTGQADTVFGFGAWKLGWDSAFLPPVRPVAGYLPRKSDFVIVENKVRYTHLP